jgi:hypothetical protein
MLTTFIDPNDWVLDIPPEQASMLWRQNNLSHPTSWSRWNAYLNLLCLEIFIPWVKVDYCSTAIAWLDPAANHAIWDVVNGSLVTLGAVRIALIPTTAIDQTTIDVPQEWVDIPAWAADYYLGLQVATESRKIHIYGYATHKQLKTEGLYDSSMRTYDLNLDVLEHDLNSLWLTYSHQPIDRTRAAIEAIPPLTDAQVDRFIEQLSNPAEFFARLAVPFSAWAGLMENPIFRQRLYQQRLDQQQKIVISQNLVVPINRLTDWLQGQVEAMWQSLDQVLLPQQIATAIRDPAATNNFDAQEIYRAKVFDLNTGQIALVLGLNRINTAENKVNLQVHPAGGAAYLPGIISLRLLSADGVEIGYISATVTETIELEFRVQSGEEFQVELISEGQTIVERFVL